MFGLLRSWWVGGEQQAAQPAPQPPADMIVSIVKVCMIHYRQQGRLFREGADQAIIDAGRKVEHLGKAAVVDAMRAEIERQELSPCICGHRH